MFCGYRYQRKWVGAYLQLANKYISDPTEIISLHQHVTVKVIGIDLERKRVQLSMKDI